MDRQDTNHLLLRRGLLEKITIFGKEISQSIEISKGILEIGFAENGTSGVKFEECIKNFISDLFELQILNVVFIENLSMILNDNSNEKIKANELTRIKIRIDSSRKILHLLSQKVASTFQELRLIK